MPAWQPMKASGSRQPASWELIDCELRLPPQSCFLMLRMGISHLHPAQRRPAFRPTIFPTTSGPSLGCHTSTPAPLAEPKQGMEGKEEIKLMHNLLVAALQTDSTRVITYRQPVNTLLTSTGQKMFPHDMSHYHTTRAEKLVCSQQRDLAQSDLLAGLLDRLKQTAEADGSHLFDHTTVVYGSNIRTGHELSNCPTLIAGHGAGIRLGQHLVLPKQTPLNNCWLTLLQGSGVQVDRHGDSTGILEELLT